MNWYLKVINQYFDFSGRARRKEYWMFTLFSLIISWSLPILDVTFGTYIFSIIGSIYYLLVFIPGLAVMLRRLHDSGNSGWFLFLLLIPIIGWVWLLVLLCLESEPKTNKWGENPKGIVNDSIIDQIGVE
ncbi:DUF805 domain-containing protein [Polaribacter glomeratus]|uniref:DUF805 domain-containing protein n=1 Tax=Polaribacter glomeratus TaxID=102 RepID=A0A2S7WVV5_9FLAO|nr:DUF805 domain-containing protein [Polaribacter glomeratus]PQJ81733.1 hypothetical protein BTO16_03735 [Polaribacter glomeratus]TXD66342.1 DUF805 domain-containing protein [Polaribacter glomeratus]